MIECDDAVVLIDYDAVVLIQRENAVALASSSSGCRPPRRVASRFSSASVPTTDEKCRA